MRRRQSCFPPPRAVPSPGSSSDSSMDCFPCTGCLNLTGFPLPGQGSTAPVQMFNSARPHLGLLSALTQDVLVVLTVAQSGVGWLGSHPKNLQSSVLDGAGAVGWEQPTPVGSSLDVFLTFAENPRLQAQQKGSSFPLSCSPCIWNFK